MYDGPERRSSELAIIEEYAGTSIAAIDDRKTPFKTGLRKYVVLPGIHYVDIHLNSNDGTVRTYSKEPIRTYFNAEAGKTYVARAVLPHLYNKWHAEIRENEPNGRAVHYFKN